ncbi:hypothetical protein AVEN_131901-1 [Araneus ventricosus]|uniref:LRRCT domain-containing protein n=1 Tax=Araneus ventricosus TaxID=182803 RepID=A0A4Y2LDE1_ARAVE|nr:hypothetical protein AVEN_131901-1 [Araneus ventricosus]
MPELGLIDLSGNRISTISQDVFGNVYNTIGRFLVGNNPVICDCRLQWCMTRYRNKPVGNCTSPKEKKGKSFQSLTSRDFSFCI